MTVFIEPRNFEQQPEGNRSDHKARWEPVRLWLPIIILVLVPLFMLFCFFSLMAPL